MTPIMKFSRWLNSEGRYAKLAIAVIVAAALLRFVLAAISHPSGDSCWHLSVARFMAENSRIPFDEPFGIHDRQFFSAAPLFHFAAAAVYKFFGMFGTSAAEFAFRLVSAFFGSLTLPFVFLIGRKMRDSRTGFLATLFVAFLPLHINSSIVSFVDSLAVLLVAVAVYFLLQRRILLSALFIGLGMAAKQTVLVMLPFFFLALLAYHRNRLKAFLAKSAASGVVIALVGFPWFVRNYLLFGNPMWPLMSKLFGGLPEPGHDAAMFSFAHLISPGLIARFYLELFGAPVGSLDALSFVDLPFLGAAVAAWIGLSLLFFLPAIIGLFVRQARHRLLLYGWLASFVLAEAVFVASTGLVSARYFLPAAPALAILWALGLDMILKKLARFKTAAAAVILIVVGCVFIFSAVESAKTVVAAKAWGAYAGDFGWIKQNTPQDALIAYNGQCLSYNVHRLSNYDLSKADYVWVNQNFRLEPLSIAEPELLQKVEQDFVPVYSNERTGTVVYKRRG